MRNIAYGSFLSVLLDLGTWEKVLEKLLCKGVPLPVSVWSIRTLIIDPDKNYFRTSSDPRKLRGSEDEGETPLKGKPEYAKPEGREQKTREALKATVPSALLGRTNFLYLRFLLLS